MTAVTLVGPPEANGGVGQYTSEFASALEGEVRVRRFDVGLHPVSHLRLALGAARDDTDAVHVQFVYSFLGPAGVLTALFFPALFVLTRARSKRLVVTLHEVWGEDDLTSRSRRLYATLVHMVIAMCADHVTFLSENAQRAFDRTSRAGETDVISHGVNMMATRSIDEARDRFGLEEDDIVVSQHGFVNPRKGVETFLAIAEDLTEYEFLLAGGPRTVEHEAYFEQVRAEAPENVTVTGVLEEEEFHAAFNATDIAVLPYEDINQSGIFNWCAAYAVPTVASAIPYFENLCEDWGCPTTFERGNVSQAVDTVKTICENAERRTKLSGCMSNYAMENSMAAVARRFEEEWYR